MSLLQRLEKEREVVAAARAERPGKSAEPARRTVDPMLELKGRIHEQLVYEVDAELLEAADDPVNRRELKERITDALKAALAEESSEGRVLPPDERQQLVAEILDEVAGFGPITSLLMDPSVSEVMVNGPHRVYVERDGRLKLSDVVFRDDDHVMHIIEKIVSPIGRRIDESSPMVDARLPDGSRVNAIIPPLALNGPTITIRKFAKDPFTVDDLVRFGTMTREIARFLEACVQVRLNIVVSGGTGAGKTTLLNLLSSFIPADERIVTIEDAAELQLQQDHVVCLESRPPNIEGKGAIQIRDLVRNALRMRPDRVVVGEVRGGEALDMLQAMNTGHDGSLTTGHANTPRDMLSRLETMVLMAGMDLPVRAIREQMSAAVDLIVQQSRMRDGSRKIVKVTEVQGMEGDVITMQDIFSFEQTGIDEDGKVQGRLRPTGIRPRFMDRFAAEGIQLPAELFAEPDTVLMGAFGDDTEQEKEGSTWHR